MMLKNCGFHVGNCRLFSSVLCHLFPIISVSSIPSRPVVDYMVCGGSAMYMMVQYYMRKGLKRKPSYIRRRRRREAHCARRLKKERLERSTSPINFRCFVMHPSSCKESPHARSHTTHPHSQPTLSKPLASSQKTPLSHTPSQPQPYSTDSPQLSPRSFLPKPPSPPSSGNTSSPYYTSHPRAQTPLCEPRHGFSPQGAGSCLFPPLL